MNRPIPKNEAIVLDPKRYLVSRTDKYGVIEFANDYFSEISGYSKQELIGQPHNIIRHPDMPKIVFKLMWERISEGKDMMALVKNLAKDGRFYWVFTTFEPDRDLDTGEIFGYRAFRKAAPKDVVEVVDRLYRKLWVAEKEGGMESSQILLNQFLKQQDEHIAFHDIMEHIHKFY